MMGKNLHRLIAPLSGLLRGKQSIQMGKYDKIKLEVLKSACWLSEQGYLGKRSSGGNISLKVENEDIVAVTPSGKPYLQMTVDDICVIDFARNPIEGDLTPSIETDMHLGVYNHRPDVNAVIHTHQVFASVLSIINRPIPALFDEVIVEIGPMVEVIPYAFSGSPELVKNVVAHLSNKCHCYLIRNHGALCLGTDMDRAVKNCELLENVAMIYYYALNSGQPISTLHKSAIEHFADMRNLRFRDTSEKKS